MRALIVSACLLLAVPAAAQATSIRISNGTLRYSVTSTAQSRMTLTQIPGTIFVHDATATFTASAPCRSAGPHDAGCPDSTVRSISIGGGNLADSFDVSALGYPAAISGSGGNDVIKGGLGNDRLNGNDGNDTIDGGPGADRMTGGRGFDIVSYATHAPGVSVSLDGRANDGSPGERDSVASDFERIVGSSGNDTISVKTGGHGLFGGAGNDVLLGGTAADNLQGGDGDDRLDGGSGADLLDGNAGRDTLDYSSRSLGVTVSLPAHTATTLSETDRVLDFEDVIGSRRDDRITGDAGPNRLSGGGGNDTLDGGPGADILIGGSGFDIASYAGRRTPLSVSLDGRANDGAGGEGDNVTPSVEGLIGGGAADRLVGSSRVNKIRGGGGNDTLVGGRGRDSLDGGAGADRVLGGAGADLISGGHGPDRIEGGPGGDLIFTRDNSADRVRCGSGEDTAVPDRRDHLRGCEHVRGRHA